MGYRNYPLIRQGLEAQRRGDRQEVKRIADLLRQSQTCCPHENVVTVEVTDPAGIFQIRYCRDCSKQFPVDSRGVE